MAFEPIETQEALDAIIEKRLQRERAKFSDYDTLKEQAAKVGGLESKLKELEGANEQAEAAKKELDSLKAKAAADAARSKIADEFKIPASILRGSDEKELREHAEAIKSNVRLYPSIGAPKPNDDEGASGSEKTEFAASLFGRG